jgi:hypothetical protein
MNPGEDKGGTPSYPPLDPHSEEGRLRRALHEPGHKIQPATKIWHNLSAWIVDEHDRHIEGRPWQKFFEPRRISPPGGYHTPKVVAATMSAFFTNVAMEQALGIPMLQTQVTAHDRRFHKRAVRSSCHSLKVLGVFEEGIGISPAVHGVPGPIAPRLIVRFDSGEHGGSDEIGRP